MRAWLRRQAFLGEMQSVAVPLEAPQDPDVILPISSGEEADMQLVNLLMARLPFIRYTLQFPIITLNAQRVVKRSITVAVRYTMGLVSTNNEEALERWGRLAGRMPPYHSKPESGRKQGQLLVNGHYYMTATKVT
jgi:hypothetical protein